MLTPSPRTTPDDAAHSSAPPRPRPFAPEPIETTTKSSKASKMHLPDHIEQEPAKVRRFAPEPIETTAKSSKSICDQPHANPVVRRFSPQPLETSHKSSRERTATGEGKVPAHIKFKPDLVETTYGGNRRSSRKSSLQSDDAPNRHNHTKKFAPVVLGHSKRSRKAGDLNNAIYQDYKTEEGFIIHAREHQKHAGWLEPDAGQAPVAARESSHDVSPRDHACPPELRRQISPLDGSAPNRPAVLKPERTHSFRCPDLDTIESSESERESGPSSLSCSPGAGSPITASDSSFNDYYKHATRIRESVDESFSQYLLDLEAKRARQRLQDQALAAFPNSDFHEPVRHYVNDDQDSFDMEIEDRPVTWEGFDEEEYSPRPIRRESTKVPWEQLEMQRYAEEREQERRANYATAAQKEGSQQSPWWNPATPPNSLHVQDNEMRSMRDRARPPMLGRDLVFPRCPSPEPARFDVTQGCEKLRQQMCYLSQQSQNAPANEAGLWSSAVPQKTDRDLSAASTLSTARSSPGKGLWGGCCIGQKNETPGLVPPAGPTGLMTPAPRAETVNPFEQSFSSPGVSVGTSLTALTTPPTPPESVNGTDLNNLNTILNSEHEFERTFEKEFPDSFITQVFNYLSLGYPSLAHPFDGELSKISRIPVSELRQDDVKAKHSPRGYIRLGPDFESLGGEGLNSETCMRWQALKLYIREWARQEKSMVPGNEQAGLWATSNRRGSWAF